MNAIMLDDLERFSLIFVFFRFLQSIMRFHSLETGKILRNITLGIDSFVGMSIDKTQTEMFVELQSFMSPGTVYRYDLTDIKANATVLYEMKPNIKGFDKNNYDIEQEFYRNRDFEPVSMFIVQKKSSKWSTKMRYTLLYGHGGFNLNVLPEFKIDWFYFVDTFDGVLAVTSIRGGGEKGRNWYEAGKLLKKSNSYDDFIRAAEFLSHGRYTNHDNLAIHGTSIGGTMVGVCINQRPDLYAAAIVENGVNDLIRFPLFTSQALGIPEYGDPENQTEFESLLKTSPLHNIHIPKDYRTRYPATLITTADHDDRISPINAFKFTAALQHIVQGNEHQKIPILMKHWKDAGNAKYRPTNQLLYQETDKLTFLYRGLFMDHPVPW